MQRQTIMHMTITPFIYPPNQTIGGETAGMGPGKISIRGRIKGEAQPYSHD
jgi:hypothetical protein